MSPPPTTSRSAPLVPGRAAPARRAHWGDLARPCAGRVAVDRRDDRPQTLPGVWRGSEGPAAFTGACLTATGYPALDAFLPGRGWPSGLIEILSDAPGLAEAALLCPMWRSLDDPARGSASPWIAWVVPERLPWVPHAPGWAQLGLNPERLIWVRTASMADAAWSIEQMLHQRAARSVVWVAPQARPLALRRVHWAARSAGVPLFACRPLGSRHDASPALLRVVLRPATPTGLHLEIIKCAGPRPLSGVELPHPLALHLLPRPPIASRPAPVAPAPSTVGAPVAMAHHAVDRPALAPAGA